MQTSRKAKTLPLAIVAVLISSAPATAAVIPGYWSTSYTVNLDTTAPVTNIMFMERSATGIYSPNPFTAEPGETVLDSYLGYPSQIEQSLLIGLTTDAETGESNHIVLFMNSDAASNIEGLEWESVFSMSEEDLAALLLTATTSSDPEESGNAGGAIIAYFMGPNSDGVMDNLGPDGAPGTAWFSTGGDFTAIAFSTGRVVGSGTSRVTFTPANPGAVPEPATLWTILAGAAGAMFLRRPRRG